MPTLPSPDPVIADLAQLPPAEKQALLARLRQLAHPPWEQIARPSQLPPQWAWDIWMVLAGRGFGKTLTGAQWIAAKARRYPGARFALIAQKFGDGRDTMVEGETGLLNVLAEHELRSGARDGAWNRSLGELFLANGSQFKIYSSEKPNQLRGPQHHFAWGDEPFTWYDASLGPGVNTTFSNLMLGLRLSMDKSQPQLVLTGTPRPVKLLTEREHKPKGLLHRDGVAITTGRTVENLANLAESFRRAVIDPIAGTRLGRQELDAEVLEDVEGALVKREWIEQARGVVDEGQVHARTVGLDPGDPGAQRSQALCQMARTADGTLWVERSERMGGPVSEYLRHALRVAQGVGATIVVERNFGGQALIELTRSVMRELGVIVPVREVVASTGKRVRAEPVALLIEQGRCRFAGRFEGLEDDWATFDGTGPSPHELDGMVWSAHALMGSTLVGREEELMAVPYV